MDNIDTYLLMCELRSRLFNTLEAEEPVPDTVLDDLWSESTAVEESLKSLMYKLDNITKRYENQMRLRNE